MPGMKSLMLLLVILATSGARAKASDAAGAATFAPRTSVAGQAPANDRRVGATTGRSSGRRCATAGPRSGPSARPSSRACPGLNRLIVSGTVGTGGHKVGLGYGGFGGTIMGGRAVHVTLLRTSSHPRGAEPHQTFIGVEPEIMLANWSLKGGPAVRVGVRTPSDRSIPDQLQPGDWVLIRGSGLVGASGLWVLDREFSVLGSGFWVLGSGFWVLGSGFEEPWSSGSPASTVLRSIEGGSSPEP